MSSFLYRLRLMKLIRKGRRFSWPLARYEFGKTPMVSHKEYESI